MSSYIPIPRRRKRLSMEHHVGTPNTDRSHDCSPSSHSASPNSFSSSSTSSMVTGESSRTAAAAAAGGTNGVGALASPMAEMSSSPTTAPGRRSSMLSPSLAKCEHTVVNIGQPDAPRLITCVKASQGFDWNQDIFLPSYLDYDHENLEHKHEPVQEIHLTDEEAAAMLP